MASYDEKLVDKYINCEDIDESLLEKLENSRSFMKSVLDKSNDYKMYYYCSDKVKNDSGFVLFLMKKFMNNLDFLCEVTDYYLQNTGNDEDAIEILIILSSILKHRKDDRFHHYDFMSDILYTSLRLQVEKTKDEEKEDYEFQYSTGLGFWYIFDLYKNNEIVTNFYASKMLNEIFIEDYYALDKILHSQYKSVEELEDKGVYNVLINVTSIYDNMLAAYVAVHKDLLKKAINKYYSVIKRWNIYVDQEESNKYDKICTDVEEYMRDKKDESLLYERELLIIASSQLGIGEKFVQYQLIDQSDLDSLEEEKIYFYDCINNSLIDKMNYNNVVGIIKSTLFPNQNSPVINKKSGKILQLDDYRKKPKFRKTGQK